MTRESEPWPIVQSVFDRIRKLGIGCLDEGADGAALLAVRTTRDERSPSPLRQAAHQLLMDLLAQAGHVPLQSYAREAVEQALTRGSGH